MAKLEQHNEEGQVAAERAFGRPLTDEELRLVDEINERLDQFAHWPDMAFLQRHRRFLHHAEGIRYFEMRYGALGRIVAERHVETDCGHVPAAADYDNGKVDRYGNAA